MKHPGTIQGWAKKGNNGPWKKRHLAKSSDSQKTNIFMYPSSAVTGPGFYCYLSGGLTVPPHSHSGFDITLQPLKGRAILPVDGGEEINLVPGRILFVDGALAFSPRNPF